MTFFLLFVVVSLFFIGCHFGRTDIEEKCRFCYIWSCLGTDRWDCESCKIKYLIVRIRTCDYYIYVKKVYKIALNLKG